MRRWLSSLVAAAVIVCGAGEARALGAVGSIPLRAIGDFTVLVFFGPILETKCNPVGAPKSVDIIDTPTKICHRLAGFYTVPYELSQRLIGLDRSDNIPTWVDKMRGPFIKYGFFALLPCPINASANGARFYSRIKGGRLTSVNNFNVHCDWIANYKYTLFTFQPQISTHLASSTVASDCISFSNCFVGFASILYRFAGQDDLLIQQDGANRRHKDGESTPKRGKHTPPRSLLLGGQILFGACCFFGGFYLFLDAIDKVSTLTTGALAKRGLLSALSMLMGSGIAAYALATL